MVPVAQSILADSFPPQKRGQAFALFGVAVVVAPVVGPTLGGWLADNVSWRWCFLINVPVGVLMLAAIAAILHEPAEAAAERREWRQSNGFDVIGFVLVATFLSSGYEPFVSLGIMVVVLTIRPNGILGASRA